MRSTATEEVQPVLKLKKRERELLEQKKNEKIAPTCSYVMKHFFLKEQNNVVISEDTFFIVV